MNSYEICIYASRESVISKLTSNLKVEVYRNVPGQWNGQGDLVDNDQEGWSMMITDLEIAYPRKDVGQGNTVSHPRTYIALLIQDHCNWDELERKLESLFSDTTIAIDEEEIDYD